MKYWRGIIIIIRSQNKILFNYCTKGNNKNKWTPVGGSMFPGETFEDAIERILTKQCYFIPTSIDKMGQINIRFAGMMELNELHIFLLNDYTTEIQRYLIQHRNNSTWFPIDSLPFEGTWPDIAYWIHPVINGRPVHGSFLYENNKLIYEEVHIS